MAKLNFTAEVDNLLLCTVDAKIFYESKVDFTNIPDKVITNV